MNWKIENKIFKVKTKKNIGYGFNRLTSKDKKWAKKNKFNLNVVKPVLFINNINFKEYFKQNDFFINKIIFLFKLLNLENHAIRISININGGGLSSKMKTIQRIISLFLVWSMNNDINIKKTLKNYGFLTLDSRRRESKKPGLKRARRQRQFTKR